MNLHCLVAVGEDSDSGEGTAEGGGMQGAFRGLACASMWLEDRSQVRKETLFHILVSLNLIILEIMGSIKGCGAEYAILRD